MLLLTSDPPASKAPLDELLAEFAAVAGSVEGDFGDGARVEEPFPVETFDVAVGEAVGGTGGEAVVGACGDMGAVADVVVGNGGAGDKGGAVEGGIGAVGG